MMRSQRHAIGGCPIDAVRSEVANIASSLGIRGPASTLVASWETARRVSFDLGRAQASSKEWLVVEGVGGGLVPAGIARAQAELRNLPAMSPSHEIEAALRIFRDTLARSRAKTLDACDRRSTVPGML
jgi:hypothetical protein